MYYSMRGGRVRLSSECERYGLSSYGDCCAVPLRWIDMEERLSGVLNLF